MDVECNISARCNDDFQIVQSELVGMVWVGHLRCDVRPRFSSIAHCAMLVPCGLAMSATVMTCRYILHLFRILIVLGLNPWRRN